MDSFEDLRQQVQVALLHLHDADYVFPAALRQALGCAPGEGGEAVQSASLRLIAGLWPGQGLPAGSQPWLLHQILHHRYVLGLTQEDTAERLELSVRTLQRTQREATHVLARRIWDGSHAVQVGTELPTAWSSQMQQELSLLHRTAPEAGIFVEEAVRGAVRIAQAASSHAAGLQATIYVAAMDPGLRLGLHPSVARQILLNLITGLRACAGEGRVHVSAQAGDRSVRLLVSAAPVPPTVQAGLVLAAELVQAERGTIHEERHDDELLVYVELPASRSTPPKMRVLVVDDNLDQAALYQSYCAGTTYELEHVRDARSLVAMVEDMQPDLVLLDIMLPDVDGWDLLLDLHVNPATRGCTCHCLLRRRRRAARA